MYSEILLEHFRNPRNMGRMEKPDGVGKVGNPACGDVMHIYIKVGKNSSGEEIIEDIKFETFGCAAAIGTSSMVTELAKGKTLEEAEKISKEDVAEAVGGLPPIKMHCSLLATKGLRKAIEDYRRKKGDAGEGGEDSGDSQEG